MDLETLAGLRGWLSVSPVKKRESCENIDVQEGDL